MPDPDKQHTGTDQTHSNDGLSHGGTNHGWLTRRDVLKRLAGLGLGAPVIAGLVVACTGPVDGDDEDRAEEEPTPDSTATVAPSATATPPGRTPSPTPASSEPDPTEPPDDTPTMTASSTPTPSQPPATTTSEPSPTVTATPSQESEPVMEPAISANTAVGFVYDGRYLDHDPGVWLLPGSGSSLPFAEPTPGASSARLVDRNHQLVDASGLGGALVHIEPYLATDADVTAYHTPAHVNRVRQICAAGGGDAGGGTIVSPESYQVALLAAGGGMAGVDAVVNGRVHRAYCNVRPPGHHAVRDSAMGFCLFNSVAVTARYAQRAYGFQRIMILDWDVHHGNGTQDAFYNDPSVLFFSLHQEQLFPPGSGTVEQVGAGPGAGYTVNLPLPPGSGDATYLAAFERIVKPIASQFQPELILVSAGQDASMMDSLGRMCVSTEGYRRMTAAMIELAESFGNGRLVMLQEGGYSEVYAPYCTLAIIETLAGTRTGVAEPITMGRFEVQPHFSTVGPAGEQALEAIRARQAGIWAGL